MVPSEVDIHLIFGTTLYKAPITHNVVLNMLFDAKNALGMEIPYMATCHFEPGEVGTIDMKEEITMFELGKLYTRDNIHTETGGNKQSYLPTAEGKVVAACFKNSPTINPDAPDIILVGNGPIIEKTAKQFATQRGAVPTFIKRGVKQWEYVGMYEVERQSFNKDEINRHAEKANRVNDVSSLLFLRAK